jgi:hypothetical protein
VLAHHREDVVLRDRLPGLIRDLRIPADFAIACTNAERFFLAGETYLDAVARPYGLQEPQVIEPVVGEDRAIGRIDEKARGCRYQEVAVGDATMCA